MSDWPGIGILISTALQCGDLDGSDETLKINTQLVSTWLKPGANEI